MEGFGVEVEGNETSCPVKKDRPAVLPSSGAMVNDVSAWYSPAQTRHIVVCHVPLLFSTLQAANLLCPDGPVLVVGDRSLQAESSPP